MKMTKILSALFCYIYLSLCCMTNYYYASAGSDTEKDTTINSGYSHMDKLKLKKYFVRCILYCCVGMFIYDAYRGAKRLKDDTCNHNSWQQQRWQNQFPGHNQYNRFAQNEPSTSQRWQRWKESFQELENLEKFRYSESLRLLYDEINDLNSNCNYCSFTNKDEIMSFIRKCQSYKEGCDSNSIQLLESIRVILGQIKKKI